MYERYINGYRVYYSEGLWFVEDDEGWSAYETFEEAKQAAEE